MRGGDIKCSCKKRFYFETVRSFVNCIECGQKQDISEYPEIKVDDIEPVEEESGDEAWN